MIYEKGKDGGREAKAAAAAEEGGRRWREKRSARARAWGRKPGVAGRPLVDGNLLLPAAAKR